MDGGVSNRRGNSSLLAYLQNFFLAFSLPALDNHAIKADGRRPGSR